MLILSRKLGQRVVIHGDIEVTVTKVKGNQVRLGIQAPPGVTIRREELAGPEVAQAARSHKSARRMAASSGSQ